MNTQIRYTQKLQGAKVLLIGGSSGIGFGIADALLQHGASVIISSSSAARLANATSRLKELHPTTTKGDIQDIQCNLGSLDILEVEIERLFKTIDTIGQLDHVVFTAGDSLQTGKLEGFSLADIQRIGTVRFFAPIIVAKYLKNHVHDNGASSFTLTTGGCPSHLMPDWAVLNGYLGGIRGLTPTLAIDMAPIRVNAIGLGPVDTELWDSAREAGQYDHFKEFFESKMTTRTVGKVCDAVEPYLYVLKDHNVSGSIIYSNGGVVYL